MEFRHEWKRTISQSDVMTLEHRLSTVTKLDYHSNRGYYKVHNLFFEEKNNDENILNKDTFCEIFRIRYYNDNLNLIKLEKIMHYNGLSTKESCEVSKEFVETVLYKSFSDIVRDPMGRSGEDMDPLIQEFYWKVIGNGLRPKTIIDYDRKAYCYPYGNVTVSIDRNIRSGKDILRFLNPKMSKELAFDDQIILNIKWDKYLPDVIKSAAALEEKKISSYY